MEEREELEKAITRLEAQRDVFGARAVDAALFGLYRRLSELDESKTQGQAEAPVTRHGGERRVVTILFCDVAGSTAMAETMDPEAWTEIMNAAFELLVEPVERYGGTGTRKARATSCVDKPPSVCSVSATCFDLREVKSILIFHADAGGTEQ